jgi:hypothetical protein
VRKYKLLVELSHRADRVRQLLCDDVNIVEQTIQLFREGAFWLELVWDSDEEFDGDEPDPGWLLDGIHWSDVGISRRDP